MYKNKKAALKVTKFPLKLWLLLENSDPEKGITWSADGQKISLNYDKFSQYLSSGQNLFYTHKLVSFLRQLNLYGFRKERLRERCGNCGHDALQVGVYIHALFKKDAPELVTQMQRKINAERRARNVVEGDRKERENFERILQDTLQQEVYLNCGETTTNETRAANTSADELRVLVEVIQQE